MQIIDLNHSDYSKNFDSLFFASPGFKGFCCDECSFHPETTKKSEVSTKNPLEFL